MAAMASDFFRSLNTKEDSVLLEHLVSLLDARVTKEMNDDSCKEFTNQEISDTLFQIGLHKQPGSSSARTNFCPFKLDLSKVYDRVDWSFSF